MDIKILREEEKDGYFNDILDMLIASDEEFVPPLSARTSTTQSDLTGTKKDNGGILSYFEELKKQKILVATENDKLIGFVSFKENFENDKIENTELPNIYISTLIVSPDGRGKGLTYKMYESLFKEYENVNVFTRTWSTNTAHIKILSRFNFKTFCVLENDRGKGIDTIYFKASEMF